MVARLTGGELHIVLAPQPVWRSDEAQAAADRAVAEQLDRYRSGGLGDDEDPDFGAVAELLSRPPEARYGWISDTATGVRLGVLVAGSARFGLVGVREGDDIWVRTFWRDRLSAVLAETLPRGVRKPVVQSVAVLRSEMLAARAEVVGSVAPSAEVRRAQRLAALPPSVIAEFSAETRNGGQRRHSPHPLRVYDTEEGRFALRVRPHYGDERMELLPASLDDIADLVDGLRRELEDA